MENIVTDNPFLKVSLSLCTLLMFGVLVSCGDYINQYSESDGAYYDPESDTLPKYVEIASDNRVGDVYQYGYNEKDLYNENIITENNVDSIVKRSQQNKQKQQNKYQDWGKKEFSDWGRNVGTKIYISNYYGGSWVYPYYNWYRLRYPYYSSWGRYYDPFWGWSYYPYVPYRHRVSRYRSIPKYKEREADSVDRSKYNGYNSGYNAGYKSHNNNYENSSKSYSRGNVGGGFRR